MSDEGQYKKKLIEVGIPLEAINRECIREKSLRHGHPSTLHLWWSRKPLAAARAVLFAQLVDDPSAHPELFPTQAEQDAERERLYRLIEELVIWENSGKPDLFKRANDEIRRYSEGDLPVICDPFAGGGTIPLEAQRLGLVADASDLNPVAVLINKALIEIPPRFADQPPVHPDAQQRSSWSRAQGLAEDVRLYGKWLRDEAFRRIGHLYPTAIDEQGIERTVIAWKWARTVRSPNPANPIETPLVSSWWLSKKKGREAYVVPSVVDGRVVYEIKHDANGPNKDEDGTITRTGAVSVMDGTPISFEYIREESRKGRMWSQLIAVVCEDTSGRFYSTPTEEHTQASQVDRPDGLPAERLPEQALGFRVQNYGLERWVDLFTNRQLVALTTLNDLVGETRKRVMDDAIEAGAQDAAVYADAVATYLGLSVSRFTDRSSTLVGWDKSADKVAHLFTRQAIPMVWDYAECNPFSSSSGNLNGQIKWVVKVLDNLPTDIAGLVEVKNASARDYQKKIISTDPPYYDNIGYADLSDFFYVWLRRSLQNVHPDLFNTMLTPKQEELVANPYRQGGKDGSKRFFIDGFNQIFHTIRQAARSDYPMTVYYAYKQQDASTEGRASTGWHTLLDGLIQAGWEITATWPVRSELANRPRSQKSNAIIYSIVLACRPRSESADSTTRRSFIAALKQELPEQLRAMKKSSIAPVDLAQASIGPGISIYSRYSRVREADGSDMGVRDALMLINQTLDEVLNEQESEFDAATRFCVKWYRSYGWESADFGMADQLARSTDASVEELVRGGIFEAKGGKARMISPKELLGEWDPEADQHISIWSVAARLFGIMHVEGADRVAGLLVKIHQTHVSLDAVKELGYLLFHDAEARGNAEDALIFNGLVSSWSDLGSTSKRLASQAAGDDAQEQLEL